MVVLDSAQQPVWSGVGYFVQDKDTAEGRFEIVPAGVSGGILPVWVSVVKRIKWALLVYGKYWGCEAEGEMERIKERILTRELQFTSLWVAFYLAIRGYPCNVTSPLTIEEFRALVTDQKYRIFLFSGHHTEGSDNQISVNDYGDPGLSVAAAEVKKMPIGENQYQLVVIAACDQAKTEDWAEAFKIDYKNRYNEEAFLGYDGSPSFVILMANNIIFFRYLCLYFFQVYSANAWTVGTFQPPYDDGVKTWFPEGGGGEDYWRFRLKWGWEE